MHPEINIGFTKKPEGLGNFLKARGYIIQDQDPYEDDHNQDEILDWAMYSNYENAISIFYNSTSPEDYDEFDDPNWFEFEPNVVSYLTIYYGDLDVREVRRLSEDIIREFNGILYHPRIEKYFRANTENLESLLRNIVN